MTDKHPRTFPPATASRTAKAAASSRGFTMVELVIVLAVACIILAISLPTINRTITNMHLTSSATSLAGVIQSTRYQAISTGCPYEVTITAASRSYQIYTEKVVTSPTAPPVCATTYSYVCASNYSGAACAIQFANSDVNVSFNPVSATSTLVLNPSGTISTTSSITTPSTFTIVFSPSTGSQTKTVTVSGVGNVRIN